MKKIITVMLLTLAIVGSTEAQQKKRRLGKEKMTPEQTATLMVKKMVLTLDLSDAQQRKLLPLMEKQIEQKKAHHEEMKKLKKGKEKPSPEERFKRANKRLDEQIAFQKKIKSILNEEQFEKFQKMNARKRMGARKKMATMKKKRAWKKMKDKKEDEKN